MLIVFNIMLDGPFLISKGLETHDCLVCWCEPSESCLHLAEEDMHLLLPGGSDAQPGCQRYKLSGETWRICLRSANLGGLKV